MDSFDGLENILLGEWCRIILVDEGFGVFCSLFFIRGLRYYNYVMEVREVWKVYVNLE